MRMRQKTRDFYFETIGIRVSIKHCAAMFLVFNPRSEGILCCCRPIGMHWYDNCGLCLHKNFVCPFFKQLVVNSSYLSFEMKQTA